MKHNIISHNVLLSQTKSLSDSQRATRNESRRVENLSTQEQILLNTTKRLQRQSKTPDENAEAYRHFMSAERKANQGLQDEPYQRFLHEERKANRRIKMLKADEIAYRRHTELRSNLTDAGLSMRRETELRSNLTDTGLGMQRESELRSNLTDTGLSMRRETMLRSNLTEGGLGMQREIELRSNLTDTGLGVRRQTELRSNLTEGGLGVQREAHRISLSISTAVIRDTTLSLTDIRQRVNHPDRRCFVSLQLEWDVDNLCPYCQCCFLKDSNVHFRQKCCLNGSALDANLFPQLKPLPNYLLNRLCDKRYALHFALSSPYYNNILALGAVTVENGRGGGFDHINGPHSAKMTGRTHHFLPRSQNGGLSYFTFDSLPAVRNHAADLNGGDPDGMRVKENFLIEFFEGLKLTNVLVQELLHVGANIRFREQNLQVEMATYSPF